MPRIRRANKRIRGAGNGGRTRNENCCCSDRCDTPDPSADGASYSLDGTDAGWTVPTTWTVDTDVTGWSGSSDPFPTREANLPDTSTPHLELSATLASNGSGFATFGIFIANTRFVARGAPGPTGSGYGIVCMGQPFEAIAGTEWNLNDVLKITIDESGYDGINATYDIEAFVNGVSIHTHTVTTTAIACVFDYGLFGTNVASSGNLASMSTFDYSSNF